MAKWDESKHPRHPAGTPQGGEFAPGDVVTKERKTHWTGEKVSGWPNPYYLGTVQKLVQSKYMNGPLYSIKWSSGTKSLEPGGQSTAVGGGPNLFLVSKGKPLKSARKR